MENHFNTPAEVVDLSIKACENKTKLPVGKMILLGIMAGAAENDQYVHAEGTDQIAEKYDEKVTEQSGPGYPFVKYVHNDQTVSGKKFST